MSKSDSDLPLYLYRVSQGGMKPLRILRSAVIFNVSGEVPGLDMLEGGLEREAFRAELSPSATPRFGWCNPQDVLSTAFLDRIDWSFDQYVVLSLRTEQRKIQKVRLDALLRQKVEAWCQENGRERCPTAVRAELKEAVEHQLLQETTPTLKVYSAIWCLSGDWVALQSCPERVSDAFRKLFHRSFGLLLEERGFFDSEDEEAREDLSAPFKAWLLRQSDEGRSKVKLEDGGEATWTSDGWTVLVGESGRYSAPVDSLAASSALAQGDVVERLPLTLRRNDREYPCVIGKNGRRQGLKLPAFVRTGDSAEQLYEATFLYEEHEFLLRAAFTRFLREREAQGSQGEAADQQWRRERVQGGWDALMERLRVREEGYA